MISEPEYCAPSTTTTPSDIPAMTRLRIGKFCGPGNVPIVNSEMIAPHVSISAKIFLFSRGINYVYPAPEDANRRARR